MSVRLAAIGDLHYGRASPGGGLPALFTEISEAADVLVICGDLTDYGRVDEAEGLARDLKLGVRWDLTSPEVYAPPPLVRKG